MNKKILLIGISLVLLFVMLSFGYFFYVKKLENKKSKKAVEETGAVAKEEKKEENVIVKFTNKMFDTALVKNIGPLGELNGGYIETQTINGILINIKTDNKGNALGEMEVFAPTDMTLEDYSYFTGTPDTPNWHLGYRISNDLKLSFDHVTWVSDEVRAVTPPTPTSGYVPPLKKLDFKAGDLIFKTTGTDQAHNWNIYLRDNKVTNTFANQDRYEKLKSSYSYINAACPFDYYDDSIRNLYIALMGQTAPGQSKTCGSVSRDVKGSISGLWHLTKDGVKEEYQDSYATPFSIYKASDDSIILYEIGRKRYILGKTNKTYKDPASVTGSHCYGLTIYGEDRVTNGYAFFKVVNEMEMQLAFSSTGSCPSTFPESITKTYYR